MKTSSIMIIATTFATLGLTTLGMSVPVYASDDDDCGYVERSQWMSEEELRGKATRMGYNVRKIEVDDGCYEVYATDSKGQRVEVYMHPVSGDVVKWKLDD